MVHCKIISHIETEREDIRNCRKDIAYIDDLELGEHLFRPMLLYSPQSQEILGKLFRLAERLSIHNLTRGRLSSPQSVDWTIYLIGKVQANLGNILLESSLRAMIEPHERYMELFHVFKKNIDLLWEAQGFLHGYEHRRYIEENGRYIVDNSQHNSGQQIIGHNFRHARPFSAGSQSTLKGYYELARRLQRHNLAETDLDDRKIVKQLLLVIEDTSSRLGTIFTEGVKRAMRKPDRRYPDLFCGLKLHIDLLQESKGFLRGYKHQMITISL